MYMNKCLCVCVWVYNKLMASKKIAEYSESDSTVITIDIIMNFNIYSLLHFENIDCGLVTQ